MDDIFAEKLSQANGPLSGILNNYASNKLLSKSRITKAEREEYEDEQIQIAEEQIKLKKSKKRKQMELEEEEKYIVPKHAAKKMKFSHSFSSSPSNTNSLSTDNHNHNDESTNDSNTQTDELLLNLTAEQVITRLRELQQPIRYFGETDPERIKRLRRLEMLEHEREEGASKGLKNVSQSIKNEVERELEAAMAQSMTQIKKDGGNELEIHSKRQEIKKKKYDEPRSRSSFLNSEDYVLFFFKRMLREWELALQDRSENEKMSPKGKNATMLQKQARRDIRALFKQLKNRTVPSDVLQKSEKMVFNAEKRNYVEAKKIFFEMAIGNAPWPMGVTMVGIHERSGRSKIFSSQIAHVMNDEVQRKYIHAMARLISFAQNRRRSLADDDHKDKEEENYGTNAQQNGPLQNMIFDNEQKLNENANQFQKNICDTLSNMSIGVVDLESQPLFDNLSMDQIQKILDDQRLGNESLLAKLHSDQKKFLRVVKHEEKKKQNLQKQMEICSMMNGSSLSIESAQKIKKLLQEHLQLVQWNEQEAIQRQMAKDALWSIVQKNISLLNEVDALNRKIDTYHVLIAKMNRQMILDGMAVEKDTEELNHKKLQQGIAPIIVDDDMKDKEEANYTYQSPTNHHCQKNDNQKLTNEVSHGSPEGDLKAEYAAQLIAKNKRYHEVIKVLRSKVDEIRQCRKNI